MVVYDSLGTPLTVDVTAVLESKSDAGNTWRFFANSGDDTDTALSLGNGTLTFGSDGQLLDSTGTSITIDRAATGAANPLAVNLDFSSMTSLASRSSELLMTTQDGSAIGTLSAFTIGNDGTITGGFTNGLTRTLGRVAIAVFSNPTGLVDEGGNQFSAGAGRFFWSQLDRGWPSSRVPRRCGGVIGRAAAPDAGMTGAGTLISGSERP